VTPAPWRTGRKVGRTIYRQHGTAPSDADTLIGVMDTPEDAQRVVDAINRVAALESQLERLRAGYWAHERAYDMVDGDLYRLLFRSEDDDA
jgi:hypothetical protein